MHPIQQKVLHQSVIFQEQCQHRLSTHTILLLPTVWPTLLKIKKWLERASTGSSTHHTKPARALQALIIISTLPLGDDLVLDCTLLNQLPKAALDWRYSAHHIRPMPAQVPQTPNILLSSPITSFPWNNNLTILGTLCTRRSESISPLAVKVLASIPHYSTEVKIENKLLTQNLAVNSDF